MNNLNPGKPYSTEGAGKSALISPRKPKCSLEATIIDANANGIATVTVKLEDDGGTLNGGVDEVTETFSIVVNAVADAIGCHVTNLQITRDAKNSTINAED